MKTDVINIFAATTQDPNFGKKYGLTLLASVLFFLLAPIILLIGYQAQIIEHVSSGKEDLPEWENPSALGTRGAVCVLTGLYLLPSAIILAISVMTASSRTGGTFFGISLLSAFIYLGGLVLGCVGLAVAATGIHSYVHSGVFTDLFNIPGIVNKLKSNLSEMGYLFGALGIAALGLSFLNAYLGILGSLISVGASAFFALALAYGVGVIYGAPAVEAPVVESPVTTPSAVKSPVDPPETDSAPKLGEWEPDVDDEDSTWMPT